MCAIHAMRVIQAMRIRQANNFRKAVRKTKSTHVRQAMCDIQAMRVIQAMRIRQAKHFKQITRTSNAYVLRMQAMFVIQAMLIGQANNFRKAMLNTNEQTNIGVILGSPGRPRKHIGVILLFRFWCVECRIPTCNISGAMRTHMNPLTPRRSHLVAGSHPHESTHAPRLPPGVFSIRQACEARKDTPPDKSATNKINRPTQSHLRG